MFVWLTIASAALADPPANDNFNNPTVFGVGAETSVTVTGSLAEATREFGEVLHGGVDGPTAWWTFSPLRDATGVSYFDTGYSRYRIQAWVDGQPATFAIYGGISSPITEVPRTGNYPRYLQHAEDGDEGVVVTTWVDDSAYEQAFIAVTYDGTGAEEVTITATRLDFLQNDNFSNAIVLSGDSGSQTVPTEGWSVEAGSECNASPSSVGTLWWRWQAPSSGRYSFATFYPNTQDHFPNIRIFTGSAPGALTELNPSATTFSTRPRVAIDAVADETYHICIGDSRELWNAVRLDFGRLPDNTSPEAATLLAGTTGHLRANLLLQDSDTFFRFQPASDGRMLFSWIGRTQTGVAVLLLNTDNSMTGVCNDTQGGSSGGLNLLNCDLTGGETYLLRITTQDVRSVRNVSGIDYTVGWHFGPGLDFGDTADLYLARYAVLPSVRAYSVDQTPTFFATVINPSSTPYLGCRLSSNWTLFRETVTEWRITNPATNEIVSGPNPLFSLNPGQSMSLVFTIGTNTATPAGSTSISEPYGAETYLECLSRPNNGTTTTQYVNRFIVVPSLGPVSDIIAVGATLAGDGVARVPTGRRTAFSMAAVNIGYAETIRVAPEVTFHDPDLNVEICETNPSTGACLEARSSSVTVEFAENEVRTFSLFVGDDDTSDLPFRPINRRIMVFFTTPEGFARGGASVAVTAAD